MSTCTLSAVGGAGWETSVAFAADLFLAIVFGGKGFQRRFDYTAPETTGVGLECIS